MTNVAGQFDNLSQVIFLDDHTTQVVFAASRKGKTPEGDDAWHAGLYIADPPRLWVYHDELPWEEFPVLAGIKGGYLHIADLKGKLADAQQLKLEFHPPKYKSTHLNFELSTDLEASMPILLQCMTHLLTKPDGSDKDKSEVRALKAQISSKDAEIAHLNARLASAKATLARNSATADNHKKGEHTRPTRAHPRSASESAKAAAKRKYIAAESKEVVEDEFAGSDDDDEDSRL